MDEIRPWLYIGKYRDTLDKDNLETESIKAMLQLAEYVEQKGVSSLYLPVEDLAPLRIEHIKMGIEFIKENYYKRNHILIACGAGMMGCCCCWCSQSWSYSILRLELPVDWTSESDSGCFLSFVCCSGQLHLSMIAAYVLGPLCLHL